MDICTSIVKSTGRACVHRALTGSTTCGVHKPFVGDTCTVCLEDVTTRSTSRRLKCGHLFHKKCISQWLNSGYANSHCCATCRTPWRQPVEDILPKFYSVNNPDEHMLALIRGLRQTRGAHAYLRDMNESDSSPLILWNIMPDGGSVQVHMTEVQWRLVRD